MKRSLFFSARARRLVLACSLCLVWTSHSTAVEFQLSQVSDLTPGEADSYPEMLTPFGGSLYFMATPHGGYQDRGIYRTDGEQVTRLAAMTQVLAGRTFPTLDGYVYFPMPGPDGSELARTDGESVMQVADIRPGPDGSSPNQFHNLNGQLIFAASGPNGRTLYRTDGVRTVEIEDIHPEADFISIDRFTELGGELYFAATGPDGHELYRTDGERVHQISDIVPGPADSIANLSRPMVFRDEIYFIGNYAAGGQLYKTDGNSVTELHIDSPFSSPLPTHLTVFKDQLFFSASGPNGRELYKTDGTTVTEVADLQPGLAASWPGDVGRGRDLPFVEYRDELYFNASGPQGNELHKTDGETITVVTDFSAPFIESTSASDLKVFRGELYFTARGPSGPDLYKTDGVNVTAFDINPSGAAFYFDSNERAYFVEFDGHLVFQARGPNGLSLFTTDGTTVTEVAMPHRVDPFLYGAVEFDNALYFAANGPDGRELYKLTIAVPEPATWSLLLLGTLLWITQRAFGRVTPCLRT